MTPSRLQDLPRPDDDDNDDRPGPHWGWTTAQEAQPEAMMYPVPGDVPQWPPQTFEQLPMMPWDAFDPSAAPGTEQYHPPFAQMDLQDPSVQGSQYVPAVELTIPSTFPGSVDYARDGGLPQHPDFDSTPDTQLAIKTSTTRRPPPQGASPAHKVPGKTPTDSKTTTASLIDDKSGDHATPIRSFKSELHDLTDEARNGSAVPDTENSNEFLLERNRAAAHKFRKRKRKETRDLEADERDLERINEQLSRRRSLLREEVLQLKTQLLQHAYCDCEMIREYFRRESRRIVREAGTEGNGASDEWPVGALVLPSSQDFACEGDSTRC